MINPDFAALAAAYGAYGETVTTSAEFPGALERARSSGKPAIIELKTDPAAVSHRTPA
jgi:acetolactate synthase-1/2/3 large subunit